MKKSKMMRLASCMLVLTLLTTCMISGTFAKYVTEGSSQDTARVAKWGVTVTGAADMFKTSYAADDSSFTLDTNSVVSNEEGKKVVAPGTKGALTDVILSGTPEVAVRVTYDATVDLAGWNIGGVEYYCPLVITVEGNKLYGLDYTSEADFEAAVKTAIEDCKQDYKANTDLSTVGTNAPSVSWAWAFEGTDGKQTDVKDTALGNQAAAGSAATVTLTVTTTVTQID